MQSDCRILRAVVRRTRRPLASHSKSGQENTGRATPVYVRLCPQRSSHDRGAHKSTPQNWPHNSKRVGSSDGDADSVRQCVSQSQRPKGYFKKSTHRRRRQRRGLAGLSRRLHATRAGRLPHVVRWRRVPDQNRTMPRPKQESQWPALRSIGRRALARHRKSQHVLDQLPILAGQEWVEIPVNVPAEIKRSTRPHVPGLRPPEDHVLQIHIRRPKFEQRSSSGHAGGE